MNCKERLLIEATLMNPPLILLIPRPAHANMRAKGVFLHGKRKLKRLLAVAHQLESHVRLQCWQSASHVAPCSPLDTIGDNRGASRGCVNQFHRCWSLDAANSYLAL